MTKKINEQDDLYSTKIDIDLTVDDFDEDVDFDMSAEIKYQLYIEYRSWGIKEITPMFTEPLTIQYLLEGESEYRSVTIDLSETKVEYVEGGSWVPTDLNVRITKDGRVLSSEITMYYLGKE